MSSPSRVQPVLHDDKDNTIATEYDEEAVEYEHKPPIAKDPHQRRSPWILITVVVIAAVATLCVVLTVVLNSNSIAPETVQQEHYAEAPNKSGTSKSENNTKGTTHDSDTNPSGAVPVSTESSTASTTTTTPVLMMPFDPAMNYPTIANGTCPSWLNGTYPELPIITVPDIGLEAPRGSYYDDLDNWKRSFAVEPNYTVLMDEQGQVSGVVFNVETTPEASPEDLHKPVLSSADVDAVLQLESGKYYRNTTTRPFPPMPNVTVEAQSSVVDQQLVFAGGHGFFAATMTAFAQHLPLALKPDDLWTIIVQGFARHVDEHAEELRQHFVSSQDPVMIHIQEDRIRRFEQTPPEQWEEWVFPAFAARIQDEMSHNPEAFTTLAAPYSTTTPASSAAAQIALLATLKNYLQFSVTTSCGIPKIRLDGTLEDWMLLRNRTQALSQWMMPGDTHGELWITDIVVPILDEFVDAFQGTVNVCFWQSMIKFRNTANGSGSYDFLSGWLPTLFPYLMATSRTSTTSGQQPNPYLRSWKQSAGALLLGPSPDTIPLQLSSAPVLWTYFEQEIPVHFHAGFRGVAQEDDGTIKPVLGWYITDDPEQT